MSRGSDPPWPMFSRLTATTPTRASTPPPGCSCTAPGGLETCGRIDDAMEGAGRPRARAAGTSTTGNTMVVIDPIGRDPALSAGRSIDRVFAISSTEMTLEQFLRFRPNHPLSKEAGDKPANIPVGVVSWYDAVAYCAWLDEKAQVPARRTVLSADRSDQGRHADARRILEPHRAPTSNVRRMGICRPRLDHDDPPLSANATVFSASMPGFKGIPATSYTRSEAGSRTRWACSTSTAVWSSGARKAWLFIANP